VQWRGVARLRIHLRGLIRTELREDVAWGRRAPGSIRAPENIKQRPHRINYCPIGGINKPLLSGRRSLRHVRQEWTSLGPGNPT
jgi:hypothetical protein